MTAKKLAAMYGVNVQKVDRPGRRGQSMSYWTAYRGGNGTGAPVVEVADAYTLRALALRVERWLSKSP